MSGFEYLGGAIVPLGSRIEPQKAGEVAATSDVAPTTLVDMQPAREALVTAFASAKTTTIRHPDAAPISPKDVVRLARARLREVEREIKRIHKLETERDELKRLLDAAAGKPLALVRSLPTRSAKPA
jgi:hypothetical protein